MSTSETPATAAACGKAAGPAHIVVQYGEVRDTPLNRLKASPKNVRRVGHSAEVIESRAARITHKGVLQPLVVEPEVKNGQETGYYLVSAGKGRRQALRLPAKRKALAKGAAVRCVVSLAASTRVNSDCGLEGRREVESRLGRRYVQFLEAPEGPLLAPTGLVDSP
ncbi:ParB N-terminal domain-containing protein [Caulobacter sp. CCNWLY153]|uniref:ParB N-terminal domain-containing protein n=1 Tax=Caulobacter TaxID=75 RepID=UPI001FAEC246|nr:ParB N-terminal domain-containing protein [Caulobacter radicis]